MQLSSQMTICVTSDILAIGADHLKDEEEEFSSDRNNAHDPRLASWFIYARTFLTASAMLLGLALSQCPTSTLLTTAAFIAPALLWTTPISFKKFGLISRRLLGMFGGDMHQSEPPTSAPVLVIKRIPGMKAIFNGIIRGYVCVFTLDNTHLNQYSSDVASTLSPSPCCRDQAI
jgi:hypothetical protein